MSQKSLMKSTLVICFILVLLVLSGCSVKGDMSPTSAGLGTLMYIESLDVNPTWVVPRGTSAITVHVIDEHGTPAVNQDVRFTVSDGAICIMHSDTTVKSDSSGFAYATFTAPPDSGSVRLRTVLCATSDVRWSTIPVRNQP